MNKSRCFFPEKNRFQLFRFLNPKWMLPLTFLFYIPSGYSDTILADSTAHNLLLTGIHQIHTEQYDSALSTFDRLILHYPDHPVGYFCKAGTYKTVMQNYRINRFESEMDSLLDMAIQIGKDAHRKDALARFYMGGAYGFRGLHKVRKRDWVGAFGDGLKGLRALENALDINPDLYDAYYGLGAYHYWRSAKAKILRFLPGFYNEKRRGIWEIWQAINKGTYTPMECKFALVWIYYDNEEFEKADALNKELLSFFPKNSSCLYMRIRIDEKKEDWENMAASAEALLNHLSTIEYKSIGFLVECHYLAAVAYFRMNAYHASLNHLETALSRIPQRDPTNEIEGVLEDFKEIAENVEVLFNRVRNEMESK